MQLDALNQDMMAVMRNRQLERIMQVDEPVIDECYNVRVPT